MQTEVDPIFQMAATKYLSSTKGRLPDFVLLTLTTNSCTDQQRDELSARYTTEFFEPGKQPQREWLSLTTAERHPTHNFYDAALFVGKFDSSYAGLEQFASHSLDHSKLVGLSAVNAKLLSAADSLRGIKICCTEDSCDQLAERGARCSTTQLVERCRNLVSYQRDWQSFMLQFNLAARGQVCARQIAFSSWFEAKVRQVVAKVRSSKQEDFASEIRIRLIERFSAGYGQSIDDGKMCSPSYWFEAMKNQCRSLERHLRVRYCHPLLESDEDIHPMSTTKWSEEQKLAVLKALHRFPKEMMHHRDIVMLRYLDGLQVNKIADRFKVSTKTISRMQKEGTEKLKVLLGDLIG